MTWLLDLYETYENNIDKVGEVSRKYNGEEYTLLPIAHTTQTAHVEVTVNSAGDFISAHVIEKGKGNTLIPSTEASASRSGSAVYPYPLHDKLSYSAGDYQKFGGVIKNEVPFDAYISQLGEWVSSQQAHHKIISIYDYVKKGCLIEDLVKEKVLHVDQNNKLISKWEAKHEEAFGPKPDIFKVVTSGQEATFVRFNVADPTNNDVIKVWNDTEVYESYIAFYNDRLQDYDLCYVTGESLPATTRHSNKIRNSADKAKLISANDNTGFTFRGKFEQSSEVASISFIVSQKAHNALKWLINKQGKIIDNRAFLFWEYEANPLPNPLQDTFDLTSSLEDDDELSGLDDLFSEEIDLKGFTNEHYANEVHKAMTGYKRLVKTSANINAMVLDSATTGRMAVLYYRNMDQNRYFDQLERWHTTCAWLHRYRKNKDGDFVEFIGAPSSKDIAFAAYGSRASDKIVKGLMERLLPCILDGRNLPNDIVKSAINRASNPVALERWEWEKTLGITCALISRKEWEQINSEDGVNVRVREDIEDRDYLFGRLLAVADVLERSALGREENRATNAIRYMSAFSKNPSRTWGVIQSALQPYQAKLGAKATYYSKQIDDIASRIPVEQFTNKALSEKYLLGFYSQRHELYQSKKSKQTEEEV